MNYFQRRRARRKIEQSNAGQIWLLPSSTPELTPDDWRVIRNALTSAIVHHYRNGADPAAVAATLTLDKISKVAP